MLLITRKFGFGAPSLHTATRNLAGNPLTLPPRWFESQGELPADKPIRSATTAELSMTAVIARCRPNFNASSLPTILAGIARREKTTLTTIGVKIDASPCRNTTNVQNATSQVLIP
jgi:hypothetical protein